MPLRLFSLKLIDVSHIINAFDEPINFTGYFHFSQYRSAQWISYCPSDQRVCPSKLISLIIVRLCFIDCSLVGSSFNQTAKLSGREIMSRTNRYIYLHYTYNWPQSVGTQHGAIFSAIAVIVNRIRR